MRFYFVNKGEGRCSMGLIMTDYRMSRSFLAEVAFMPVGRVSTQTNRTQTTSKGAATMELKEIFLAQLDREAVLSRKAIEKVPEGKGDWKPHEKSMALGRLAPLSATMLGWHVLTIERDELDLNDPASLEGFRQPTETRAQMLKALEDNLAKARKSLQGTTEEHLKKPWKLRMGEQVLWEQPRYEVIADTFSHLGHHRGQLTVYLRLLGEKVPALYGPSADEN
jgi:uncharacterized damage-inducible protein DinB